MPNVGYRCNKKTKHMLPSGFRKFLVHSVKKPEVLPMCNESYCAQIAHDVSSKDCKAIVERVAQLAIGSPIPTPGYAVKKMNRQQVKIPTSIHEDAGLIPGLSELRIQRCHKLCQLWLRSRVEMNSGLVCTLYLF